MLQVVRQALVRPAVQSVLAAAEAARPPGGVSGAEELGPLLQGLLQACRASCRQLLEATLAPHSGLTGYELLGNAILAEVDEALAEGLPGQLASERCEQKLSHARARGCSASGGPCGCAITGILQAGYGPSAA